METTSRYGSATDGLRYFKNVLWWAGMATMGLGEFANFAAYSFAPAILVTPLGALSVIVGAILASVFLGERINTVGKAGCALCLMGSVIVVLNAPRDGNIESVEQIMNMVMQPPFLLYFFASLFFVVFMITKVAGKYGQQNPIVYLSICSVAGSITVTACKAFGIALKLTFAGNNQFVHFSTYAFAAVVVLCIIVQMNYFNKALEQFDTNLVTPIYYVFFTSATILASVALFQGFSDSSNKELASLFCGFITIFIGVFLLNITKTNCNGAAGGNGQHQPLPTDEPGRRFSSFSSRGRISMAAASFDISDLEDNASSNEAHESYPMHERGRTVDAEKSLSMSRRPTLAIIPRSHRWAGKDSGDDTNDDETTDVPSSGSLSNSSGSYHPHTSPMSLVHDDDDDNVHIDIPLSPSSMSYRRKSLHQSD
ncbi:hypothetical protein LPJ72_004198 [Coemansia sp. Benny D160-2]|nr:hypothetical protein LPJ72_004198 [Coemansia sp. Benny D160-2]